MTEFSVVPLCVRNNFMIRQWTWRLQPSCRSVPAPLGTAGLTSAPPYEAALFRTKISQYHFCVSFCLIYCLFVIFNKYLRTKYIGYGVPFFNFLIIFLICYLLSCKIIKIEVLLWIREIILLEYNLPRLSYHFNMLIFLELNMQYSTDEDRVPSIERFGYLLLTNRTFFMIITIDISIIEKNIIRAL